MKSFTNNNNNTIDSHLILRWFIYSKYKNIADITVKIQTRSLRLIREGSLLKRLTNSYTFRSLRCKFPLSNVST